VGQIQPNISEVSNYRFKDKPSRKLAKVGGKVMGGSTLLFRFRLSELHGICFKSTWL
jgi:hypothetical protein